MREKGTAAERLDKRDLLWRCKGCGLGWKTISRAWWCCMQGAIPPERQDPSLPVPSSRAGEDR